MAQQKIFYKKGAVVKYLPDQKVLILNPGKSAKNDFIKIKSQLDTLLKIDGTKRTGNSFSMKIDDNFNASVEELLKSMGMKGGIEQEDAASMIDDAAKDSTEAQKDAQAPEVLAQQPAQQPAQQSQPQQQPMESVYSWFYEEFAPAPPKPKKTQKRTGEYWKELERVRGKNRMKIVPDDILDLRRDFALKPFSDERNSVLRALDRAVEYFYNKITKEQGEIQAKDFKEEYMSADNLNPQDYEDENEDNLDDSENNDTLDTSIALPEPNFDIDYSAIDVEEQ